MELKCPYCQSANLIKNGFPKGIQQYKCKDCRKYFSESTTRKESGLLVKPKSKSMGISKEDFRKKHDISFRLSQVIGMFEDDTFYEKADLLKMAGMSPAQPGAQLVLDSDIFKEYVGKAGGRTYYAKPELIVEMRKGGILN